MFTNIIKCLLFLFISISSSDEILKKKFILDLVAHHKKIYYAKTRVNDFTCFAKPIIYSNEMVSYWPANLKDEFWSPYAPSRIPILRILDLQCPNALNIIEKANSEKVWSSPNGWLLLGRQLEDASAAFEFIHLNTQVLIATDGPSGGIHLQEIYKKGPATDVMVVSRGEWFPDKPYNWDIVRFKTRFDLSGETIIGTAIFTTLDSLPNSQTLIDFKIDSLSKTCYNIFLFAVEYLKASPDLIITDTWGYMLPNGSWNGQVGLILANKAHVAITPFFINPLRFEYIDYFEASFNTKLQFMFRSPPLSYVTNVYILPFSTGVWLCSFFFICLVSFMLWLLGKFEYKSHKEIHYDAYSIGELFVNAIGIICQQGSEMPAIGITIRIIFLVLLVAVIFIYTAYSAYIVALLQSSSSSIQTLKDLLESRLECGVHDMPNHRFYIQHTDGEPIRKAIYETKVAPKGKKPNFYSMKEGIEKMRKGLFAFHVEGSPAYQEMQENWNEFEKCGIQEMQFITHNSVANGVIKDSPYREVFRVIYRFLIERGLKTRVYNRYYTSKPACLGSGSNFISVGIIDVYPAIMILIYGYGITIFLFILELIYSRTKKRLNLKNNVFNRKLAIDVK